MFGLIVTSITSHPQHRPETGGKLEASPGFEED